MQNDRKYMLQKGTEMAKILQQRQLLDFCCVYYSIWLQISSWPGNSLGSYEMQWVVIVPSSTYLAGLL